MSENYQMQEQQPAAAPKNSKTTLIIVIALAVALVLAVGALVYIVLNDNNGGDTIINNSTTAAKNEPGPESALERLKDGMASMDLEMIADSFAPEYSGPLKSLVNLASSFAGVNLNDLIGVVPMVGMMSGEDYQSMMPSVSYTVHEKEVNGDTARMYVTLIIRSAGDSETMQGWFGARKIDGKWYLTDDPQ